MRALVAIDFSESARLACRWVLDRWVALGVTELVFVHVLEQNGEPLGDLERSVARVRELVVEEAGERSLDGLALRYSVAHGDPAKAILETARTANTDTVVMGTNGRRGLDRFLLGSVAEAVVRLSPCTVIVVKPGPEARSA